MTVSMENKVLLILVVLEAGAKDTAFFRVVLQAVDDVLHSPWSPHVIHNKPALERCGEGCEILKNIAGR